MNILTEINYDCSFMQTIIRLPQNRNDLKSAGIISSTIEKLLLYSEFTDNVLSEFNRHTHICDFLSECMRLDQIYYVKTFPEDETHEANEVKEYICYGEYHRNLNPEHKNIFFRVDQNWDNFNFPKFERDDITQAFKKYLTLLSGAIDKDTILPSIYLEQQDLDDKTDFLVHSFLDRTLLNSLYLFSIDYWGNAFFLNEKGDLFEFKYKKGTLLQSDQTLISWTENKLESVFKPHSEK